MKARRLIQEASFGPDSLRVIGQAFDDAWAEIAGNFSGALQIEAARIRLATAILSIATDASRDADALKRAALKHMGLR